jgi:PST family polysaccharide transporter
VSTVTDRLLRGAAVTSAVSGFRLAAQFLILPVLSRLLSPHDYGLVALSMPFILFAMQVSDGGLCASLIRKRSVDVDAWSSAFWLVFGLGALLAILLAALAPLLGWIYGEPAVVPILIALAGLLVIQSITTVPTAFLQKRHSFGALSLIEAASIVTGMAAAILVAVQGGGAWALVSQQMAYWLTRTLCTWFASGMPIRATMRIALIRDDIRFGGDVVRVSGINFLSRYADTFIIGIMLGAAAAGIYSMAFQIVRLPATLVLGPLSGVLFSTLVRVRSDGDDMRALFFALTVILASVFFPTMAVVASGHEPLFRLLLSPKWAEAGLAFMLMTPAAAIQTVIFLAMTFLVALGRPDVQLRLTVEFAIVWIVMILVAVGWGVTVVAAVTNLCMLFYLPRVASLALPIIGCTRREFARLLIAPILCALGAAAALQIIIREFHFNDAVIAMIALALGMAGMLLSLYVERGRLQRIRGIGYEPVTS